VGQTWAISAGPLMMDSDQMQATIGAMTEDGWTSVVHVSVAGVPGAPGSEIPYIAFSRVAFEEAAKNLVSASNQPHPDFQAAFERVGGRQGGYFTSVDVGIQGTSSGTILSLPPKPVSP
jgi:hypothetical protein